jgi:hypothetical protein
MIKDQIMKMVEGDPKFAEAVDMMEQQVARMPIVPEDLDEAIAMLEFVLQNPDKYAEVREAAINDGLVPPQMIPDQFDQVFIVSLLVALYGLQDRLSQRGFARGGLSVAARRLQTGGQGGDSELVHVNRREAEMLRRMGGAGTVNPNTGLREYKGLKSIFKSILPIATAIFMPYLAPVVGTALGVAGTAGSVLGGAIVGGASSALAGGDPLKGALMGGVGGYMVAPTAATVPTAAGGAATMPGQAAMTAGGGTGLKMASSGATTAGQAGLSAAGPQLTPGLSQAANAAATAGTVGVPTGASTSPYDIAYKPSDAALGSLQGKGTEVGALSTQTPASAPPSQGFFSNMFGNTAPTTANASGLGGFGKALVGANLMSAMAGAPPQAKNAIAKLSPEQQEFFNRPLVAWDWNKLQNDAASNGMDLSEFMARNWNVVSSGAYNTQPAETPKMAQGGALSAVARFVSGGGTGRSDEIDAKLSDGEYVMDAETVAMLGDGSNKAGAKKLDQMRRSIRAHKGKALSKGKFSPNAKSPLAYLKEVA